MLTPVWIILGRRFPAMFQSRVHVERSYSLTSLPLDLDVNNSCPWAFMSKRIDMIHHPPDIDPTMTLRITQSQPPWNNQPLIPASMTSSVVVPPCHPNVNDKASRSTFHGISNHPDTHPSEPRLIIPNLKIPNPSIPISSDPAHPAPAATKT
jgi:hypothetical protein